MLNVRHKTCTSVRFGLRITIAGLPQENHTAKEITTDIMNNLILEYFLCQGNIRGNLIETDDENLYGSTRSQA